MPSNGLYIQFHFSKIILFTKGYHKDNDKLQIGRRYLQQHYSVLSIQNTLRTIAGKKREWKNMRKTVKLYGKGET